jgi:hypothetical protein
MVVAEIKPIADVTKACGGASPRPPRAEEIRHPNSLICILARMWQDGRLSELNPGRDNSLLQEISSMVLDLRSVPIHRLARDARALRLIENRAL